MRMIEAVFIFGVVLPTVLVVILFGVFLLCFFYRGRLREKLFSKCPQLIPRPRGSGNDRLQSSTSSMPLQSEPSSGDNSVTSSQYGFTGAVNRAYDGRHKAESSITAVPVTASVDKDDRTETSLPRSSRSSSLKAMSMKNSSSIFYKPKRRILQSASTAESDDRTNNRTSDRGFSSWGTMPETSEDQVFRYPATSSTSSDVFHTSSSLQFNPTLNNMSFGSIQQQSIYSFQSIHSTSNHNNNCSRSDKRPAAAAGQNRSTSCSCTTDTCRHCSDNGRTKALINTETTEETDSSYIALQIAPPTEAHTGQNRQPKCSVSERSDDSGYSNSGSDCDCYGINHRPAGVHQNPNSRRHKNLLSPTQPGTVIESTLAQEPGPSRGLHGQPHTSQPSRHSLQRPAIPAPNCNIQTQRNNSKLPLFAQV